MGLMKRLFGARDAAPSTELERRGPTVVEAEDMPGRDPQPGPSAEVEVHELGGILLEDGPLPDLMLGSRPQVADYPVDWPVDPATGTVFDDTWLLDGLQRSVSPSSFQSKLEAREEKARARRERLWEPGVDTVYQEDDLLRGRDWLEWDEHVYQMKRDGFLESALSLVYEMIDVASKSPSYDEHKVPGGWYGEAAVILRKLKRREEEIRILQAALADYPGNPAFADRLAKTEALLAKEQAASA
ncbi:hypothetical protein [Sinomonas atrocyanea]